MIGGDVLIDDIKRRQSHSTGSKMLYQQDGMSSNSVNHFLSRNIDSLNFQKKSFFQIANVIIKSSIATDPFLVAEIFHCGYLWCTIIVLVFVILTQLSFYLFIQSWIYGRAYSYNGIWRELFGPSSCSWIALILVIITYLTFTIWYQHELHYHFSGIVLNLWPDAPSILTNKWFATYVLSLIFIVPSLFTKRLANFAYMSMFSNVCTIIGIVCLILYYIRFTSKYNISFAVTVEESDLKMFKGDIFSIFNTIGVVNSALFYNPVLSVVVQDLHLPTLSRVMGLTWTTSITSIVIHFVGGFFSYLINPDNEGDVIFYDIDAYNDDGTKIIYPEIIIGQISTFCISICSNIFYTYFVSRQIAELILPSSENSLVPIFFCGLVVCLFSAAMNFVEETATEVADLMAGVISILLAYVFPSIFYIRQYKFSHKLYGVISVVLITIGVVVSLIALICGVIDF